MELWNNQIVAAMAELNQQPHCNMDSNPISSICQHLQAATMDCNWRFCHTQNGSGGGNKGFQGVSKQDLPRELSDSFSQQLQSNIFGV